MINYCYICFKTPVEDWAICDICDEYYCEDCSYIFSQHYQFYGSRCYFCSNQYRIEKLIKEIIRSNKIKFFLDV